MANPARGRIHRTPKATLGLIATFGMALVLCLLLPLQARASTEEGMGGQTVRVGIVEQQDYAKRDVNGIVRGFDAEQLSKISQYANFRVEYTFYADFNELLDALENGEVQIAPGISKTPERAARFLFTDEPIESGTLELRVRPEDDRYNYGSVEDISTMRLGAEAGSITVTKAREWAESANIELDLTEFSGEQELIDALDSQEIDGAFVHSNMLTNYRDILTLTLVDYYDAFNRDQSDLKRHVDSALNRIRNESPLYFQNLDAKYTRKRDAPLAVSASEKSYLEDHNDRPITVATIANDAPYNYVRDGQRAGIVPDYYRLLAQTLSETGNNVTFDFIDYPTLDEAISSVANGEADVLGATCLDATAASERGLVLTSSYQYQSIASVARSQDISLGATSLAGSDDVTRAAVLNSEKDTFLAYLAHPNKHFELIGYSTLEECYNALQNGSVDIVATSSARADWLLNQHRSGTFFVSMLTEPILPVCAAVSPENATLGSILSQASMTTETSLSTIIAQNTVPNSDLTTVLNRAPAHYIIAFFATSLLAVSGITFGINRYRHAKEIRHKDIELIEAQQTLLHSYETDALTGLPNRATALRHAAEGAWTTDLYSVMLLSIDNLDIIIESFGHKAQQQVVLTITNRLKQLCDTEHEQRDLYRYDVDKFLLVLHGCAIDSTDARAMDVRLNMRQPVIVDDDTSSKADAKKVTIWPKPSIGIAVSDGAGNPEHVIRNSGMALAEAQRVGHPFIYTYSKELHTHLARLNEVQELVENAVEAEQFYMLYQPQVDLRTKKVRGYEALVRIADSDVSPGEFIPVAESSGLISKIGRITTELVVRQLATWREEGKKLLPVSVNFSSLQIGDSGYLDYLLGLLKRYDIDPSFVEIEITESLLAQKTSETELLFSRMHDAGITILIDDFGTGYSSISYLSYIPVDIMKIDKSILDTYLSPIEQNVHDSGNAFVLHLIQLIHDLGKTTIVEGIEEAWQVKALTELDCDAIQGFYFSRPLPADDVSLYCP